MKLILPTEFENLRLSDDLGYTVDKDNGKEILKLYDGEKLIAKRISFGKKPKRYFGVANYKNYLNYLK